MPSHTPSNTLCSSLSKFTAERSTPSLAFKMERSSFIGSAGCSEPSRFTILNRPKSPNDWSSGQASGPASASCAVSWISPSYHSLAFIIIIITHSIYLSVSQSVSQSVGDPGGLRSSTDLLSGPDTPSARLPSPPRCVTELASFVNTLRTRF